MNVQSEIDRITTSLQAGVVSVTLEIEPKAMKGWLKDRALPEARQSVSIQLASGTLVHVMTKPEGA